MSLCMSMGFVEQATLGQVKGPDRFVSHINLPVFSGFGILTKRSGKALYFVMQE
jgi:hypothetical protein